MHWKCYSAELSLEIHCTMWKEPFNKYTEVEDEIPRRRSNGRRGLLKRSASYMERNLCSPRGDEGLRDHRKEQGMRGEWRSLGIAPGQDREMPVGAKVGRQLGLKKCSRRDFCTCLKMWCKPSFPLDSCRESLVVWAMLCCVYVWVCTLFGECE